MKSSINEIEKNSIARIRKRETIRTRMIKYAKDSSEQKRKE